MKAFKSALIIAGVLSTQSVWATSDIEVGKALFQKNCIECHGVNGGMDMERRLAPPMMGVRMHYKKKFKDKETFVAAIMSWVEKPSIEKSQIKMAVHKFNLMPQLAVAPEDVRKIASYIYEGDLPKPKGMEEHMKEMRDGKGGCKGEKGGMEHKH